MIISELLIKDNGQECVEGITLEFPYCVHFSEMSKYIGENIPWHWHEEVEFVYAARGDIKYCTTTEEYLIREGNGCFVNSNILHMVNIENRDETIIISHIFGKLFLAGFYSSIFDQKYISPILESSDIEILILNRENENQMKILELMKEAYRIAEQETQCYEFLIRNIFSAIWIQLLEEFEGISHPKGKRDTIDTGRIKSMISYISKNYSEKLELKNIAKAADISERECLRCFKRNIGMTPFEYILKQRVSMAASKLIETDDRITDIGIECGFATSSYFGKTFKKIMGYTPGDYREKYSKQEKLGREELL